MKLMQLISLKGLTKRVKVCYNNDLETKTDKKD